MASDDPTVVEATAVICEVTEGVHEDPFLVTFRYDPTEPYAIFLTFCDGVVWMFARELLYSLVRDQDDFEAAGLGDVSFWFNGGHIMMRLTSPDEYRTYQLNRAFLTRYVRATYQSVARGREQEIIDAGLDERIAELHDLL